MKTKALKWWDTLRNTDLCIVGRDTKDKGFYCREKYGYMRMYQYLTVEEIESIYVEYYLKLK